LKAKEWQRAFPNQKPLTINVNLSGKQFVQPDLSEKIDQILRKRGVERHNLKLEITETAIMENVESAGRVRKAGSLGTASGESQIAILEQLKSLLSSAEHR
jgi:EAL domain-containing protein (putative c-di-GMP-specific phosphodiesterase class I)